MAMRTLSSTSVTGMTVTSMSAPLSATTPVGSASADVRGYLSGSCTVGGLGSCFVTVSNATVTVPVTVFADHALASPASTAQWYWFIANKWHQTTYYAVSPAHVPGGGYNCSAASNCITVKVAGGADLTSRKAILVLAGRGVNGSARPTPALADYLESDNSDPSRAAFAQQRVGRTFNDRIVSVASY
jgi:hypothetical protein